MYGYGGFQPYGYQYCGYEGQNNNWIWIVLIIFIVFFLCWGNNNRSIGC